MQLYFLCHFNAFVFFIKLTIFNLIIQSHTRKKYSMIFSKIAIEISLNIISNWNHPFDHSKTFLVFCMWPFDRKPLKDYELLPNKPKALEFSKLFLTVIIISNFWSFSDKIVHIVLCFSYIGKCTIRNEKKYCSIFYTILNDLILPRRDIAIHSLDCKSSHLQYCNHIFPHTSVSPPDRAQLGLFKYFL